jgi:hypothetical protein
MKVKISAIARESAIGLSRNTSRKPKANAFCFPPLPTTRPYVDLSNQPRLVVSEDKDLGIRPERLLKDLGETEFIRRHQSPVRSLAAFEKSEYADDWREQRRRRFGNGSSASLVSLPPVGNILTTIPNRAMPCCKSSNQSPSAWMRKSASV